MAYDKQNFTDGQVLKAEHLNHMEEGIADAMAKAEAAAGGEGNGTSGLTSEQVIALNGMFSVCAFIKGDVSTEYRAFKAAFGIAGGGDGGSGDEGGGTVATLTGISATYSGADVVVGTAVSDLVGIIVKAHYSDGSTAIVPSYTISGSSGEIVEGKNVITISYGGKTTTIELTGVVSGASANILTPIASGGNYVKCNSEYNVLAWEYDAGGNQYSAKSYALTAGITYRITGHGKNVAYPQPPFIAVKASAWDGSFKTEKATLFNLSDTLHIEHTDASVGTGTYTRDYTPTEDCILYVHDTSPNSIAWVMY